MNKQHTNKIQKTFYKKIHTMYDKLRVSIMNPVQKLRKIACAQEGYADHMPHGI